MSLRVRIRNVLFASLIISFGICVRSSQAQTDITSMDYQVYDAVLDLMQFPMQAPHIVIADTTLNSGCGDKSNNPVRMNDCGIWSPESSAKELGALLHQSIPQMDSTTWNNLISKNAASTKLQDNLKSPWPHKVRDIATKSTEGEDWSSPNGIILFSQIGFNDKKDEALVYVLFLSYMKGAPTSGNFFLFRKDQAEQWMPAGRVTYMQMQ